jgi:hypothetical protein
LKSKYNEPLTLTCKLDNFLKEDLRREWQIWSKCFGKVILINGPSSSGKTTLSQYLTKFGFYTVSSDNIRDELMFEYANNKFGDSVMSLLKMNLTYTEIIKVLYRFKFTENKHQKLEVEFVKTFQQVFIYSTFKDINFLTKIDIFERIYYTAKAFIFSGHNVVIDLALYDRDIDILSYSFRFYPITIGFLYSSLEENLMKCFQRNDISSKFSTANYRHPVDVINEYRNFYKFTSYKSNAPKFEKIDKDTIRNILEVAVLCQNCLLDDFKNNIMNPEIYKLMNSEIDYESKIRSLLNISVEAIKKSMELEIPKEIWAIPAVKYDFIIKSLGFKADVITIQDKLGTKQNNNSPLLEYLYDTQEYYHIDCISDNGNDVYIVGNNASFT